MQAVPAHGAGWHGAELRPTINEYDAKRLLAAAGLPVTREANSAMS